MVTKVVLLAQIPWDWNSPGLMEVGELIENRLFEALCKSMEHPCCFYAV